MSAGHWRFAETPPRRKLPLPQQDHLVCARSPLTATFRAGAVPPVLRLRWQYSAPRSRRIYHPQVPLYFLGPTSLGKHEDESNGLPNDTAYITHAVLTSPDGALSTNTPCAWTTREVPKSIRIVRAVAFESLAASNTNGRLPAEQPPTASAVHAYTAHCSRHRNQETSCKSFR